MVCTCELVIPNEVRDLTVVSARSWKQATSPIRFFAKAQNDNPKTTLFGKNPADEVRIESDHVFPVAPKDA